jgi:hypothetical protein
LDRLRPLFAAEWIAYWRRLFRSGSGAKNNLFILGVIALLGAARYIPFLEHASGAQVQILLVAVFLAIAATLRNDGPVGADTLQRFPLTTSERFLMRVFSAIVPPWSWIVLLFSFGIFRPLSKLGVLGITAGIVLILAAVVASQIAIPLPRFRPRSRTMTLLRKEIRYILGLPEHALILLITLAFCIYLIGGEGLQADALRAVFGILSVLSVSFPMSAFGFEGASGLDRYALFPITGAHIVRTKNLAFAATVAAQRAPIFALALWRFGPYETLWGVVETASLALLVLAWGNIVSVRHAAPPDSEPTVIDGLLGTAAALVPAAAAIGILRGNAARVPAPMCGMLALCAALYYASQRFAGPYFSRHFDRIRAQLNG